ncbi:hypothetical protein [Oceaniglobus roseus]|uniref:hypothetical protein n=1 Tax=Oceaniglobus roseus TaxID=1737570 RepID=UPI000C7F018C|nr:hypothetical protein [Kandeliimicrobium roseum]
MKSMPVLRGLLAAATFALAGGLALPASAQQHLATREGALLVPPPGPQFRTPKGYRPAWEDGRLNPYRGKQLYSGALQTALIWTQTVPRRLVDPRNGRDVTRNYKYLIYPYTDYDKQRRDLAGGRHVVVQVNGTRMVVLRSSLDAAR